MIMPMPEMATSAPAAWVTSMGRYCEMRWRWWCTGVVTAERRSISPAHEQGGGGDAADPPHPDAVGGHLGRRRPGGAAGPAGHQLGMKVGRVGPPLDHGVVGQQPFAHGGQGQVDLGVHQADVQIRPGLHLDHGLLAVVQEGRGQAEPPPVLVHHL